MMNLGKVGLLLTGVALITYKLVLPLLPQISLAANAVYLAIGLMLGVGSAFILGTLVEKRLRMGLENR